MMRGSGYLGDLTSNTGGWPYVDIDVGFECVLVALERLYRTVD